MKSPFCLIDVITVREDSSQILRRIIKVDIFLFIHSTAALIINPWIIWIVSSKVPHLLSFLVWEGGCMLPQLCEGCASSKSYGWSGWTGGEARGNCWGLLFMLTDRSSSQHCILGSLFSFSPPLLSIWSRRITTKTLQVLLMHFGGVSLHCALLATETGKC